MSIHFISFFTNKINKSFNLSSKMLEAMQSGDHGDCGFIWNAPGMKIILDFENDYQNQKGYSYYITFRQN